MKKDNQNITDGTNIVLSGHMIFGSEYKIEINIYNR